MNPLNKTRGEGKGMSVGVLLCIYIYRHHSLEITQLVLETKIKITKILSV